MAMNIEKLPDLEDEKAALEWVLGKKLLRKNCEFCQAPLQFTLNSPLFVPKHWMCIKSECNNRYQAVNCLKDSFFKDCTICFSLPKQIHLIKYLCFNNLNNKEVAKLLKIDRTAMYYAAKKFQEVIIDYFKKNPIKLGGGNVAVAVKNLDLCNKNNPNRNRLLVMVDTSKSPLIGFMQLLKDEEEPLNNNLPLLLKVIKLVVEPYSIIASDEWQIPLKTESDIFTFRNCSDSQRNDLKLYIDSHSKTIQKIKNKIVKTPDLYIYESMWRERYQHDAFNIFIDHLRAVTQNS